MKETKEFTGVDLLRLLVDNGLVPADRRVTEISVETHGTPPSPVHITITYIADDCRERDEVNDV